jgi:DNA-binding FadR family transcriptional regulator
LFRAFRDVSWAYEKARSDYRRLAGECREHLSIAHALAAGDERAAARAMSQHIRAGVKYWSRSIPASTVALSLRERSPAKNGKPE